MQQLKDLLDSISAAVNDAVDDHHVVAVAYSGGLDSSLVAAIAHRKVDVTCYTACTQGSHDQSNAPTFAKEQGLTTNLLSLSDSDIRNMCALAASILDGPDPASISYTVPLLTVLSRATEDVVLTGSLADELFGGYAKYASSDDAVRRMDVDLEKALSEYHSVREYAKKNNKILASPFADGRAIEAAKAVPLEDKIGAAGRKIILRRLADSIGLPGHDRPKKAAQYSSGVMKAMERLAKQDAISIAEWVTALQVTPTSQDSNRA